MRIYIVEKKQSLSIDDRLFESHKSWIPYINDCLKVVTDKKDKMQLNADYLIQTMEEFSKFYRLNAAATVATISMLRVGLNAYLIDHAEKNEVENLTDQEVLLTEKFIKYTETIEYKKLVMDVAGFQGGESYDGAVKGLLKVGQELANTLFDQGVFIAIKKILNLSSKDVDKIITPQLIKEFGASRNINGYIKSVNRNVLIHFNGTEEEYLYLDRWLSYPDMKVEKNDNMYQFDTEQHFVDWFNQLRSRIESEFSFITLMDSIEGFGDKSRYRKNIENKISQIVNNNLSVYENRKLVINYLHKFLNQRQGIQQCQYIDYKVNDLQSRYSPKGNYYQVSLYD